MTINLEDILEEPRIKKQLNEYNKYGLDCKCEPGAPPCEKAVSACADLRSLLWMVAGFAYSEGYKDGKKESEEEKSKES